eukprot:CAMPEP_0116903222 /NCGR_PEP_ID=MMETSP0467-20121206/10595_1 /TAXON_ID=283647 /ORGANISM="Mesodinium pulex, Strain SPMC105" /LENGTH=52 /DNA_ID=CAMNT_0004577435 /DNA_START=1305 /DNA_END=1463 /DNA_ORIENTATION=-
MTKIARGLNYYRQDDNLKYTVCSYKNMFNEELFNNDGKLATHIQILQLLKNV